MRTLWALTIRLLLLLATALFLFNAVILGLTYQAYGMIALLGIAYRMTRPRWQVSGSYGTARLSGLQDLLAGRLLCRRGLTLGRTGHTARPSKAQALRALLSPRLPSE
jgi:hypothetical protein